MHILGKHNNNLSIINNGVQFYTVAFLSICEKKGRAPPLICTVNSIYTATLRAPERDC